MKKEANEVFINLPWLSGRVLGKTGTAGNSRAGSEEYGGAFLKKEWSNNSLAEGLHWQQFKHDSIAEWKLSENFRFDKVCE